MIMGLKLFQIHQSYNLHFSDNVSYDCLKYNFKTKVTAESFNTNKFKWQFSALEKRCREAEYDMRLMSLLVYLKCDMEFLTTKRFIKVLSNINDDPYKIIENNLKKDLQFLKSEYNSSTRLFETEGLYPNIYNEYMSKRIDISTLVLLSVFITDVINISNSRDIIAWPRYVNKVDKVKGLFKLLFDSKTIESLFVEMYLD